VETVEMAEAPAAGMQILIGPAEGAPHFVMRRFSIEPGGRVPKHVHDTIEHVQYVLEGEMVIGTEEGEKVAREGDGILIPAGVAHWYENRGSVPVLFLCTVPQKEHATEWLE